MKPSNHTSARRGRAQSCRRGLLAALFFLCAAPAAPAATQRIRLNPGSNTFGQHVVEPVESAGTVQQSQPVANGDLVLAVLLPEKPDSPPGPAAANRQYTIEFDNGFWAAVESWRPGGQGAGGNVRMVIRDPGAALRPAANAPFRLRRVRTVSDLFGRFQTCKLKTGSLHTADLLMIRCQDRWLTLWHSNRFGQLGSLTGVQESWRIAGRDGDHPDVPVFFVQAVMVIRRGPPVEIPVEGEVKPGPTLLNVDDPLVRWKTDRGETWAFFSSVHGAVDQPDVVAKPLAGSGLIQSGQGFRGITPGPDVLTADNVLLFTGGQGENIYRRFFSNGNAVIDGESGAPADAQPLTSAVIIHRRTPAAYFIRLNP